MNFKAEVGAFKHKRTMELIGMSFPEPGEDTLDDVMAKRARLRDIKENQLLLELIRRIYEEGLQHGYRLGFNNSREGFNGEYPFEEDNCLLDEDWLLGRDEAIAGEMGEALPMGS